MELEKNPSTDILMQINIQIVEEISEFSIFQYFYIPMFSIFQYFYKYEA